MYRAALRFANCLLNALGAKSTYYAHVTGRYITNEDPNLIADSGLFYTTLCIKTMLYHLLFVSVAYDSTLDTAMAKFQVIW